MLINCKKVIVAMSGGVDSSVSAFLLKQQGYLVEGVFMKNWEEDDNTSFCSSYNDLMDAQAVCDKLGIVLHVVNFSSEYWFSVFMKFLSGCMNGVTLNPDILCNKEIKFKIFLNFALEDLGADFIATGHYVRTFNVGGNFYLIRGVDSNKDQSYFLYTLNSVHLNKCLFPIGALTKTQVRNIARDSSLPTAFKKDSTGICFIGKRKFSCFISRYVSVNYGSIVTVDGDVIGSHDGLVYYTLGQRKGLKIGGLKTGNNKPWYVVDKDVPNNNLIVAQGSKHPALMSFGLLAHEVSWINVECVSKSSFFCTVKIRYRHSDMECKVVPILKNGNVQVFFKNCLSSVTPGQSAVFYLGERCLGGGVIKERYPILKTSSS